MLLCLRRAIEPPHTVPSKMLSTRLPAPVVMSTPLLSMVMPLRVG